MSARTRARRRALELLFEAEQRALPEAEVVRLRSGDPEYPMKPYAVEIVDGVVAHREQIDELVQTYARGWSLERMPAVDRALLRIAVWEMLFNDEVDDPVAISEVVDLARKFSTDESPKFINGVLDRIRSVKPTLD
ncbi:MULTISPECIES: transcription antitermination factor NusB [Brevibacterium]|uniref:Transcription antitermination protein NusB n=1 Tax=Brevibacterium pityocampae TaxID=506594 RepID=A0ABP8JN93_9MICO|nr:transcription antitermination factor NusB [Brevibacterium sp. CS2]MCK1802554.1 transcription antitermination factor NusB [Brevibacterium sp. R8603A2]QCP05891.1 transcription antitermination factor NusB [Brevibacterium sp. CS2]